jgi:hypothetical protein
MNIIESLQNSATSEHHHLTKAECSETLALINSLSKTGQELSAELVDAKISAIQLAALIPKEKLPLVNAIEWALRWLTLIFSFIGLYVLAKNWVSAPLYFVCGLTLATFYSHAVWMTFRWCNK